MTTLNPTAGGPIPGDINFRHPSGRTCAGAMPAALMGFVRLLAVELKMRSMGAEAKAAK